ncbi:hypothetical protein C8R43DRAFT_1020246 [Mycena crocata]|nr:hypothetical protein C8R43DRAFT_1020246 [Mycena crocata]
MSNRPLSIENRSRPPHSSRWTESIPAVDVKNTLLIRQGLHTTRMHRGQLVVAGNPVLITEKSCSHGFRHGGGTGNWQPVHLEFRIVRCDPRRESLWRYFAQNQALTARVHTLEIIYESCSPPQPGDDDLPICVPKSSITPGDGTPFQCASNLACLSRCAPELATAISKMHGLTRLWWDHDVFLRTHTAEPIFSSVAMNCPNLRELELTYHDGKPYFHSITAPLWAMTNLTRLSLTVTRPHGVIMPAYEHFPALFAMLGRCPELQDLRLAFESRVDIDIGAYLETRLWPKLQCLILEGDLHHSFHLTSFLRRHESLEILSLVLYDRSFPVMPNLRWLSVPALDIENFTESQFPQLEYLTIGRSKIPTLVEKLNTIPILRGATVDLGTCDALERFAQGVPHLERLGFAGAPWNLDRSRYRDTDSRLPSPECFNALTAFNCLTHLDSAVVLQEDQIDAGLPDILHAFAVALPKLQYICIDLRLGVRHNLRRTWYTLARDSLGTLLSWKETRDRRLVQFHDWEDVCRQIGLW